MQAFSDARYWIRTRIQNSQTQQQVTSIRSLLTLQSVRKPIRLAQATRGWQRSSMRGPDDPTRLETSLSAWYSLSRRSDFSDKSEECPAPCNSLVLYLRKALVRKYLKLGWSSGAADRRPDAHPSIEGCLRLRNLVRVGKCRGFVDANIRRDAAIPQTEDCRDYSKR